MKRADLMLKEANKLGCDRFISPQDVVMVRTRKGLVGWMDEIGYIDVERYSHPISMDNREMSI